MFCARCGRQLPEASAQFCPFCGQALNVQPAPPPPSPHPAASAAPAVQYAPPLPMAYGPQGVGGALLFFCICFTILWPVWVLSQYARFNFRMTPLGVIGLVRLAFGVFVGVMLWTRQSAAMVLLRIHLAVMALFAAYSLLNIVRLMLRYHYSPFAAWQIFSSLGITMIFLLISAIYFSVSERVRATYGSKLFG